MVSISISRRARFAVRLSATLGLSFALSLYAEAADLAGDLGSCPGTEVVEANLTQASSSGYFIPGLKLIVLNRPLLKDAALPVQKFIFAHECAHADPTVGEDEDAADCAAAKRGQDEGWIGRTEIIQICVHLGRMPVDATHKPAGMRCANIRQCARDAANNNQSANAGSLIPSEILRRSAFTIR